MKQEMKSLERKQKEDHIQTLREVGRVKEDVIALVEEDLNFGLTIEQTNRYMKSNLDLKQMQVFSTCLRKSYSEEVIRAVIQKEYSAYQMEVALEFYDKGISIESISEGLLSGDTPAQMRVAYQLVLEELQGMEDESKEESQYVQSLMEQVKEVVSKIELQEQRYQKLEEKLSNATIARLRVELEKREQEITSLKVQLQGKTNNRVVLEDSRKNHTEPCTDTNESSISIPISQVDHMLKKPTPLPTFFERLVGKKKLRQDIVKEALGTDLSKEQLAMVRYGMEQGLTEEQLIGLIHYKASPEQMEEVIGIAILENQLTGGQ